ncbi:MAG: hypothetical protein RIQ77_322, partial [Pseudomonadota bacterium]
MLCFAILCGMFGFLGGTSIVTRPNLGTVLVAERDVNLSPVVWHHTVALPVFVTLPPMAEPDPACEPSNATKQKDNWGGCIKIRHLDALYRRLFDGITADIENQQQCLKDIMTDQQKRVKRGWFNLLGTVAKKVMGVATESDINILNEHISKLQVMIASEHKNRVLDVEKLHSFEIISNERIDKVHSHLVQIDKDISKFREVYGTLRTYTDYAERVATQAHLNNDLIRDSFAFSFWLAKYDLKLGALHILQSKFQNLVGTVDELVHGRLTASLIPTDQLKAILQDVNRNVIKRSSHLHVPNDINVFYSTDNMISVTFDKNNLYVKIKIPIMNAATTFTIYKLDIVPMPTSVDSGVYTILTGLPDYLAISKDFSSYIELTSA